MTQSGHRFAYEHAGAQRFKTAGSALKRRLAGQAAGPPRFPCSFSYWQGRGPETGSITTESSASEHLSNQQKMMFVLSANQSLAAHSLAM
jgi:hypothetical protein